MRVLAWWLLTVSLLLSSCAFLLWLSVSPSACHCELWPPKLQDQLHDCSTKEAFILVLAGAREFSEKELYGDRRKMFLYLWINYQRAHDLGYQLIIAHNNVLPKVFVQRHTTSCVKFQNFSFHFTHPRAVYNARFLGVQQVLESHSLDFVLHMDIDSFCLRHPFNEFGRPPYVLVYLPRTEPEAFHLQRQIDSCFPWFHLNASHLWSVPSAMFGGEANAVRKRLRHVNSLLQRGPNATCDMGVMAVSYALDPPLSFESQNAFDRQSACRHGLGSFIHPTSAMFRTCLSLIRANRTHVFSLEGDRIVCRE